jgi:Domain of unknown function (DUF5666)
MLKKMLVSLAFAAILSPAIVVAQTPASAGTTVRLRGSIEALDADSFTVATSDGQHIKLALPADIKVTTFAKIALSDIKPGDYVGSAAVRGPNGRLRALEVHVFPEALRGTGDGQRPWDLGQESSMTNGAVDGVAGTVDGRTIKIAYKGGTAEVDVGVATPVVLWVPNGDKSVLKTGAAVIVGSRKAADGTYTATSIQAEKDGVKPPL